MKLLTNEQQESYENAKMCYISKEKFGDEYMKTKTFCKVRDHCHYTGQYGGVAHSTCNLKYSVPKKVLAAFHNESNYDYNFIIKELSEQFKNNLLV